MLHFFHPAVVHWTIAFLLTGSLIEIIAISRGRQNGSPFGERLFWIGAISLVPTLFLGYLAANSLAPDPTELALLKRHEQSGWILAGVVLLAALAKSWSKEPLSGLRRWGYVLLLLTVVAVTINSALLGGEMVYLHGLGVEVAP